MTEKEKRNPNHVIQKKQNKERREKKTNQTLEMPIIGTPQEKPTPAFLSDDYPYKAVGEAISDLDSLDPSTVYEIKCHQCEMSIRSQGVNIKSTFGRLSESGCIGCGNKDLVIKKVDMSGAESKD